MNTPQAQKSQPKRAAPLIPIAEVREVPLEALTPFEFDSFFGSFFEPTVAMELTQ